MAPAELPSRRGGCCADGATGEIRTPDLLITNQTLYQAKPQWQQAAKAIAGISKSVANIRLNVDIDSR